MLDGMALLRENSLTDCLFQGRNYQIIEYIAERVEGTHALEISQNLKMTYPHVTKMLSTLQKNNLTTVVFSGRTRRIKPTQHCVQLSKALTGVFRFIQSVKADKKDEAEQ